ncbi:MAG: ATP-binding cassette domain-containing protein [Pseudomonadota bacterium]
MIIMRNITLRRGSKLLLDGSSLTVQPGQHLALIGANGSGKSSLLAMLLGELGADAGILEGLENLQLAHMAQEVEFSERPAQEFVWRGDGRLAVLYDRLHELEASEDHAGAARVHTELEEADGYSAERRANELLRGLGFALSDADRPASDFSGGWRIRLNLARALMAPSDALLLDEPTNHLDLDATLWLQSWLQRYRGTLVMISHDRDFIDATCNRVVHIEHQVLHAYRGNYTDFERQRAERLANEQSMFAKQQRRSRQIEAFVARFRYKASKAKQAQSRLKELQRLQSAAPAYADSPFDFSFLDPEKSSDPLLQLNKASLGYNDTTVLEAVNVQLRPGNRYGLLGRNGAGKSTLLKSLVGQLPLLEGERTTGEHCSIGYFDQQQLEALDLDASPLLHLQRLTPEARDQEMLNFLGGFGFRGEFAKSPIRPFSGGEKARLALSLIVWQQPNLLVMDEPTNHLDLPMRHALEIALQSFAGALLLVSHDRHLLRNCVDELLLVHDGKVAEYREDLARYERWILSGVSGDQDESPVQSEGPSRRSQRQQAAAQRERLRPLQKALAATEHTMESVQAELEETQQALTDSGLYEESRRDELTALLRQESALKQRSEALDEQWLEQQQQLETLESHQNEH